MSDFPVEVITLLVVAGCNIVLAAQLLPLFISGFVLYLMLGYY